MGIDIYARARKKKEKVEDIDFNEEYCGERGYLREAYHGGPYVTKFLVEEAFDAEEDKMEKDESGSEMGVQISVKTLKERLPIATLLAVHREQKIYGDKSGIPKDFIKELDGKDGAKTFSETMSGIFDSMGDNTHRFLAGSIPEDIIKRAEKAISDRESIHPRAQEFVDFVEFCENTEKETGEETFIYASY